MGGSFEQSAIIAKDPYAWLSENNLSTDPVDYPKFVNPLQIVVDALNKMQFPAEKKVKHPMEPTARKVWKPGIDPESRLVPESVVLSLIHI